VDRLLHVGLGGWLAGAATGRKEREGSDGQQAAASSHTDTTEEGMIWIRSVVRIRLQLRREAALPVSVTNSQLVYDAIKGVGIRLVSALPETWLVHLVRLADEDSEMRLVRLAKEEEGVGVSAGAHFAGVKSAMLMQNHGFLQAINGIVGVSLLYKIPLLMLITDRGGFGEKDPWQTEGGKHTRPVLNALNIAHDDLTRPDEVQPKVAKAMALAQSSLSPVALLLGRDLMWEEPR
jgi:sulfopyruvate decarboxylase subunit alpha